MKDSITYVGLQVHKDFIVTALAQASSFTLCLPAAVHPPFPFGLQRTLI
jgi:hypothetical protein